MTLGPWYVNDTPTTNIVVSVTRDGDAVAMDGYASAEVLLYGPSDEAITWGSTPTIDNVADTVTILPPPSSPFATAGIYTMYLRLTASGGGTETFLADVIRVLSLTGDNAWATIADVLSITNERVTSEQLDLASSAIAPYANRGISMAGELKPRDRECLRQAVAWQAAWLKSKSGFVARDSVDELQQDGLTIVHSRGGTGDHKVSLAPLAARALKNLSWKGTRTTRVKPVVSGGLLSRDGHADSDRADELFPWSAL